MTNSVQVAALVILALNAILTGALITLKAVHRRRIARARLRRAEYRRLISRHLTFDNCTDPITARMVVDPAFIDALLEIRGAISGEGGSSLGGIMNRHGLTKHQVRRLRARFPLGRRLRAAVILAELGDETSIEALMEHLDDQEPEIRIQAARGLARMKWTPAIDALVSRFGTETPWVRSRFADTLAIFGTEATWPLIAYIRVNHEFYAEGPVAAIRALGVVGDDAAVRPLIEIFHGARNPEIVIACIETLGLLGNPLAGPALRSSARASDWRVRAKSMTALADIGDSESVDILGHALGDRDFWVRHNAAAGLTRLRGGSDRLYDALVGKDRLAADTAAEALVDSGDLAAARHRESAGVEEDHDRLLLAHMGKD